MDYESFFDERCENTMDVTLQKQKIREVLRAKASEVEPCYQRCSSTAICQNLINHPSYRAAKVVLAFVGTALEIDTELLFRTVWADEKILCVPRCKDHHLLDLCRIHSYEDLSKGSYGILEPKRSCPIIRPEQVDFAVIPCLSFDREGNRLGQGGGYYDRFLDRLRCPSFLVCRERFVLERLPAEEHDRRCTYLVTEQGIVPTPGTE